VSGAGGESGSSYLCPKPDISYQVSKEDLDNVYIEDVPKRTERDMVSLWQEAQAKVANADRSDVELYRATVATVEQTLTEQSLCKLPIFDPEKLRGVQNCYRLEFLRHFYPVPSSDQPWIPVPALVGFKFTDAYQAAVPDFMHTILKGIGDYFINPKNKRGVMHAILQREENSKALTRVSTILPHISEWLVEVKHLLLPCSSSG